MFAVGFGSYVASHQAWVDDATWPLPIVLYAMRFVPVPVMNVHLPPPRLLLSLNLYRRNGTAVSVQTVPNNKLTQVLYG
jgi:hypothetical protein